jgi:hypothetical protein
MHEYKCRLCSDFFLEDFPSCFSSSLHPMIPFQADNKSLAFASGQYVDANSALSSRALFLHEERIAKNAFKVLKN